MNNSIDNWIDRVQNLLDVQKDLCLTEISMQFTRYELVDLMVLLNSLKELEEKREKGM